VTSEKCFSYKTKHLTAAAASWAVVFALAFKFASNWASIPTSVGMFFSAVLLIFLAIQIVSGFSKLKLHRTHFLAIGAIGLIAVFFLAKPLVKRTDYVSHSSDSICESFLVTAQSHLPGFPVNKILPSFRNEAYMGLIQNYKKEIPESQWLIMVLGLAQLTLASGIGLWIGEGIDEASHLIPIAIVATLSDIWSVSAGATSMIIVSSNIHFFLLRFPLIGGARIPFLIGLTDFLFFAIFFQAAVRFNLGLKKNIFLLVASFLIAVASAIFSQTGLPVLPFMAAFFVVGNFRQLDVNRKDIKLIALFVFGMLIAFGLFTAYLAK
jgi:hypothetical protein